MLKILAFAFLLVGLFVVFQNTPLREVQAQGGCGSVTFSCNLKPVFREESNECGGNLLSALKSYTCETSYDSVVIGEDEDGNALWGCEEAGTSVIAGPHYTTPTLYFTCGDYRRPDAYSPDEDGSGWYEQATCECSGSCYPAPDTKEVSDPSLDPANVLDESRNPKLPVNLGWKDNVKKLVEDIAPGYACSIGSYNYEVTGNGKTITGLEQENLEDIVGECQLTPDKSYEWRVRACLDAGGQDCGAWSQKAGFETSDAPELLSPFDEDFENKKDASVPIPTILEWCPVPQAPSYLYRIYEATGDEKKEITTDAVGGGTTQYNDELVHRILNKGVRYFWEVALCTGGISGCGSLSQLWSFVPGELELKTPILKSPKYVPGQQEPAVNMLSRLEWDVSSYAQIYLVQIRDASKTRSFFIKRNFLSLSDVWQGNLSLDSSYTWRVAACTGESLDRCQKTGSGNTSFSEEWRFRTTGAPPTGLRAVPTENGSVAIPTTLEWNDMPGAASYSYDVMQGANSIIRGVTSGGDSRVEIGKELRQNTQYAWRVRTCADAKEEICSAWSQSSFRTAFLVAPQIIPDQTLTTPSDNLSWKTVFGASFYRYELTYAALGTEEVSSSCRNSLGKVTSRGTATGDSALLSLLCTGTYQVRIQGCTDEECKDAGPWSSQQNFSVKEPDTSGVFGLVPCGVGVNNPNTPWDERQPCGFEHMLLLVRNLIDFALWKLSLIIVVLFAIATGAMFYLSFGGSDLLAQIKSIWKAVGAGVLVLLLSWLLLNLLLGLLGFDVNIFGRWYEIPLQ